MATKAVLNDGGQAFPCDGGTVRTDGMTVRDYFAAKAIQGLCADYGRTTCMEEGIHDNLAMIAYRIADAMLRERAK